MQLKPLLHAAVPRVECPEHGKQQLEVSWSEPRSRFTLLFERLAIDVSMSIPNVNVAQALSRTGWEQTGPTSQRAVTEPSFGHR